MLDKNVVDTIEEKTLIDRFEREINNEHEFVKVMIEEAIEGNIDLEELKEELKKVRDFRLVRDILGVSEREQILTDKIIRILTSIDEVNKGNIEQAKFNIYTREEKQNDRTWK